MPAKTVWNISEASRIKHGYRFKKKKKERKKKYFFLVEWVLSFYKNLFDDLLYHIDLPLLESKLNIRRFNTL